MDIIMSQMEIPHFEGSNKMTDLVNEIDEMDIVMSQIDTVMIQRMGEEVDADIGPDIPLELLEQYKEAVDKLLPNKSGNRYIQAYEVFRKWQTSSGTSSFDEKVVVAYFNSAAKKYKPSTLWSMYSMLKKTLICKHNVDISKFSQLSAFLKKEADGFQSKQSNVFTPQEINKFIMDAPNISYLAMKAVLVFGLAGACRGDELTNLILENVKDDGKELVVKMPNTKTKVPKMYIIDGEFATIIREYWQLRPPNVHTDGFFLQYRNGKCVNQVMGKHSIAKVPKEIAKFLHLPEPNTYTGHSYRRTSTTIAADAGASIEEIKRLGQWKNLSVAEKYIQDSLAYKRKLGNYISGAVNLPLTNILCVKDETNKRGMQTSTSGESSSKFTVSGAVKLAEALKANIPMSTSGGSSSEFTVSGASTPFATKLKTFATPDNEANIIFHFGGECSKFTIINIK